MRSLTEVRSFSPLFAEFRKFSPLTTSFRKHAEDSTLPDFRDLAKQACVSKLVMRKAESCKDLFTMPGTASVLECVSNMVDNKIGSTLIVDPQTQALQGIFTERDYARRIALLGLDSSDVGVSGVMTRSPICVTTEATIDDCVAAMLGHNCRHLPVVEAPYDEESASFSSDTPRDGRLLGVLSIRDIVQELYWIKKTVHAQNKTRLEHVLASKSQRKSSSAILPNFIGLTPEHTVLDALHTMQDNDVGAICVARGRRIEGIFTDRDYLSRVLLTGRRSSTTSLSEVMSPRPVCALEDYTVEQSIGMMMEGNFRHLPIVSLRYDLQSPSDEDEWECIGVLSIKDLLASMAFAEDV